MLFTSECDGVANVKFVYTIFNALAMFLYFLELV